VTGYLTAQDGIQLRYSVLLPKGSGRFPVLINYSGYDAGSIGGPSYLRNDTTMSASLDRTLVEHGYAVMGVNARGTGCSEGQFEYLRPSYGEDGRDAVEFAAGQPWSNGAIGMVNWSWAGMSQLATASERPPHLKAIAPGMVFPDPRLDNFAPGGVSAPDMIAGWRGYLREQWEAVRVSASAEQDSRCLDQITRNLESEELGSTAKLIFQHPLRDEWIQARQLRDRTHLIQVPVLSMESFQDEAVTSREGYYQETLEPDRVWMVQTNGPHDLYESQAFRSTLVAYVDHFVKGIPNGFEKHPHLEVWMDTISAGTGVHGIREAARPSWTITRAAIAVPVRSVAFVLGSGGSMTVDGAPAGLPDSYAYPTPGPSVDAGDPDDPSADDIWGPLPPGWKAGSVAFTSPALDRDLLTYGSASADLWVSSNSADADLQVTLTSVLPNGQEMFIQRGWLRLSDRALDAARSSAVRAALLDTPGSIQPLNPGQPVLARVEINKFSFVFRKGSRIRIWIDTPSDTGLYRFSYYAIPATNMVWHDAAHMSKLVLGELLGTAIPSSAGACGHLLKEPCRPDPLAQ
jgi:putative CocE/NonD family hydrolase